MSMASDKLKSAIEQTKIEIHRLKEQFEQTTDPEEKHQLRKRLKELRLLQIWHLEQVG